ncbi:Transmembrane domain-containing protein [Spironucleus salmonicida]|uniref:Transmembrane domain-containing protein n=1 Tax=Spironucleus salmonicida TaxID=348837 RepID=V6M1A4_9EUKA|nr:Transmembrane domain-containing protein [Spironucleus salmonicida]KAH0570999.1 Transmembrane domain-containing protein [Spironucleus salmonicida]|eukprot:EST46959.1 Transmembrane domain-containing protein [Spironucleus salmonicida]
MAVIPSRAWFVIIGMLCFGATSTLSAKGMQQFTIAPCEGCPPIQFNHPYVQTLFMFGGQFFNLIVHYIIEFIRVQRNVAKEPLKEGKSYYKFFPHVFLFLIPTMCDTAGSTLYNVGLFYSDPSVYQILRNVRIIFVAMFSAMIWRDFRQKFDLPQILGLIILFTGAMISTLSSVLFDSTQSQALNPLLGSALTIIGCIFSAMFVISQEIFLRKIQLTCFLGVGNEGAWGILLYAILLPIFNSQINPFSSSNEVFDDVNAWAFQIRQSPSEIAILIGYMFATMGLNYCGMEVTRRVSAATRSTFDACRTILVWAMSLAVGWETWEIRSTLTRIGGFVLVCAGVFLYNNLLRAVPFLRTENKLLYGKKKPTSVKQVENTSGSQEPSNGLIAVTE